MTSQQAYESCQFETYQCRTCAHEHGKGECERELSCGDCKGAVKAGMCPTKGCAFYEKK